MEILRRICGGSRRNLASTAFAAALITLSPAMLSASSGPPGPSLDRAALKVAPKPMLSVTNDNWLDVHVYIVRDGEPFSLGVVTGPGKRVLDMPSLSTTPGARVQILVLPIGGVANYLSPAVTVNPGDVVHLNVENSLPLSTVTVEPKQQNDAG